MKNTSLFFLLLIFQIQILSAQNPAFDIYCNRDMVKGDSAESYFRPVEIDFVFNSRDTLYEIKSGEIVFKDWRKEITTVQFRSNTYIGQRRLGFSDSAFITIKEIQVSYKGEIIETLKADIKRKIKTKQAIRPSMHEAEIFNEGTMLTIKNKPIGITHHPKNKKEVFKLSLADTSKWEIEKLRLVLVRGKRPVCTVEHEGNTISPDYCFQHISKNDFIIIDLFEKGNERPRMMRLMILE